MPVYPLLFARFYDSCGSAVLPTAEAASSTPYSVLTGITAPFQLTRRIEYQPHR